MLFRKYYSYLEYGITAHSNYSFLLISALKTKTCVMALWFRHNQKFSRSLIEILVLWRLLMGSQQRGPHDVLMACSEPELITL
jgi:hypothetical protein